MVVVMIMVMDYYDVVARALLEMSKHFLGPFIRELYFEKFFHKKNHIMGLYNRLLKSCVFF